jgi:superfamily II DNA/RNA helicase
VAKRSTVRTSCGPGSRGLRRLPPPSDDASPGDHPDAGARSPTYERLLTIVTFADLGASEAAVTALAERGIITPFPVQELTIPVGLAGTDVIGQARTGTGKTYAFGVPLLDRLGPLGTGVQALVVVPTRELCVQVHDDLVLLGRSRGITTHAIYGGRAFEPQVEALRKGVDVVVGTPGRLLDLARQGHLDLSKVRTLVLDEADEMLDLGFLPDVEKMLAMTPARQQTMLFSATMPGEILTLARRFLRQPLHLRAESAHEEATVPTTQQHVFRAHSLDKMEVLARILQAEGRGLTIVFCRTKRLCDRVGEDLANRGFAAAPVHGDLAQAARERALRAFRAGKVDILVATDVAARGIDVSGVTHVVNYACPEDEKVYLHRIGRTGRAGQSGTAVTLVDWDDLGRWAQINTALRLPFPEPVETYSTSPHLYEALDIPARATGVLPRSARVSAGLEAEPLEDIGSTGRKTSARGGAGSGGGSRGGDGGPGSRGGSTAGTRTGSGSASDGRSGSRPPRRRTRGAGGGSGVGSGAGIGSAGHTEPGGALTSVAVTSDGGSEASDSAARRPRRRRRRSGSGGGGAGGESGSAPAAGE